MMNKDIDNMPTRRDMMLMLTLKIEADSYRTDLARMTDKYCLSLMEAQDQTFMHSFRYPTVDKRMRKILTDKGDNAEEIISTVESHKNGIIAKQNEK